MKTKTPLLEHQRQAVEKLMPIRVGALYMEMGTGKTRTALEMIARRLDAGKIDRALWLCPCSVRQNLRDDLAKHADGAMAKIAIYGIESLSGSERLYEMLMRYVSAGSTMIVVDESNLVKVLKLAEKCRYRLILNGTPISRNEADLYAQWYILDWRILGYRSFWSFAQNHLEYDPVIPGKVRRTLHTDYLVEKIAPYTFQVKKEDCFKLPGKTYRMAGMFMTDAQEDHYATVTNALIEKLDEQKPETVYRMFAAAQAVISGMWVEDDGKHFKTRPMFEDPEEDPRIAELLRQLAGEDGKVLIFAKYRHEIDKIVRAVTEEYGDGACVRFDGTLRTAERQRSLDAFRAGARFMAANKACAGYGLNLQFCRSVIYYSNDWDYATRIQSEDRVHRLGQEGEVKITDIYAFDSLDGKIIRCLERKEGLLDSIKRELTWANGTRDARGKFRSWLKGELEEGGEKDGEGLHGKECV